MSDRDWRRAALACLVVQLVVLYWPRPPDVGGGLPGLDLVVHLAVFAVVAGCARRGGLPVLPVAVALVAHAAVSEVLQESLVPGRTGDWRDALADVLGLGLGLVAGRPRPPAAAGRRRRAAAASRPARPRA